MNNLHIKLDFRYSTRLLKQTRSIIKYNIANKVYIASLHSIGLNKKEFINSSIILDRFHLYSRFLPKTILFQFIKNIEFLCVLFIHYRNKGINVVNIHSLTLLPVGVLLKFAYKSKLVYDIHELETETIFLSGFRKTIFKYIEKFLISFCDTIFVVSESIAEWYATNYLIEKPVVVLNTPNYNHIHSSEALRHDLGIPPDQRIFLYQGGLSPGRGIESLLSAFKSKSIENVNAVIVFMGYGPLKQKIEKISKKHKNIFFHKAVHPDELLKYTASADFGLSLIENKCLSYCYCMPNKVFEYTMAGLPIIVSNLLEMASFVDKYKIGIILADDSHDFIVEGIHRMLSVDRSELIYNAQKCSRIYCWEVEEKKMIDAYISLLSLK